MKRNAFREVLLRLCRLFTGTDRHEPFSWSAGTLKGLALSPSDLPAIETGCYAADMTRRLR